LWVNNSNMYKDIISYQLADGITEQHLFKVASKIIDSWMQAQPGFVKWEIHSNAEGSYTDIVYWESKAAAQKAELAMANMTEANEWYACYKTETIKTLKLTELVRLEPASL